MEDALISHIFSGRKYGTIIISSVIRLRVPATTANLGPGFDCLGLALDLWNEVSFEVSDRTSYSVNGEGTEILNSRPDNLLMRAVNSLYEACGEKRPGLRISAENHIPLSSGMGSSAAAILAGLLGANEMLGRPLERQALLSLATSLEGHPDNLAAALLGGLVVSIQREGQTLARRQSIPELTALVVKPEVNLSTSTARRVLPQTVPLADAVFNIGRTALVVDALQSGDLELLRNVMDDRLHQKQRLAHIPAGKEAFETARTFGAAALSGAGPSIIIFLAEEQAPEAQRVVSAVFKGAGIASRSYILRTSDRGAEVD